MRRFLWLSIGLAALLATFACGGGSDNTPAPTGTTPGVTPALTRLHIVDQNVLHGLLDEDPAAEPYDRFPERVQLLASALAEAQPDIIFLQEVVIPEAGSDYPKPREVLLQALGAEYTAVFGDAAGRPIDTGTLGQLTLTRLPVLSSENHSLEGVRAVHRVTLETDAGAIDVYNAHLEGTKDDPQAAVVEINKVLQFIDDTRTGGPVILAGDFNAVPGDPSIKALLDAGFSDALATAGAATCNAAGDPGCTNSTMPLGDNAENHADHRIDYIFVLPGDDVSMDVEDASLFHDEPIDIGDGHTLRISDHIGVQATLVLE
ncbi:MAG: endonuclease/exonuclease/phosphatase family protein [Dehalococcoidia bacterium]